VPFRGSTRSTVSLSLALAFALGGAALSRFARANGARPEAVASGARPEAVASGARPEAVARPFVVALDPGHGGSNLGAADAGGLTEKDVTLALARRVRVLLAAAPDVRVVLCRDADVLVPIRARSRCAVEAGAALFVSLHANAAPPGVAPGTQRGFELYVLPPEDVEDDATLAALAAPGTAGVWDAHQIHVAADRALAAARAIEARLREGLSPRLARGIRQRGAALDVLRGARAPAVLVEVGFLDHAQDRATLSSSEGREPIARALAAGVLDVAAAATRQATLAAPL
jgi:N-acetylmuramoyl-L-alanine amidase